MLQYVVGAAAEQAAINTSLSQTETCPIATQPSVANISTPARSQRGDRLQTSSVATGENSFDDSVELEVISPVSDNHDVEQSADVLDLLPVAPARVPKKRGRKPKRRRRVAAALSGTHPPTSTGDLSASRPIETTLSSCQPSFDNCSSLQKDAVAAEQPRPVPKKRGRKPKKRPEAEPEPEVAVVDDVMDEPAERSPGSGSESATASPATALSATAPVTTEVITATLSTLADNDASASGGNENRYSGGVNSGSTDEMPRRRGRKRKNASASDKDEQQNVDEIEVQSVWKVTSPTAAEYPPNGVPRIKVTNIRVSGRSTKTAGSVETAHAAGDKDRETVLHRPSVISGGRQPALKVKSWQPIVRRTDSTRTAVPVLERAREWIEAVPKPSHDDWTGPVFPAREMVDVANRNGSTDRSQPAATYSTPRLLSPAKSVSRSDDKVHAGSPNQRLSGADSPAGRVMMLPGGSVAKSGVIHGPSAPTSTAVDHASRLMYVIGGRDEARGPPTAAAAAASNCYNPKYALPVNSDAAAGRPAVSSFDKNPRGTQYTTKRVRQCVCVFAV